MSSMEIQINESDQIETMPVEFFAKYMDNENIIQEWPFFRSFYPVATILTLYLLIVLKIGPNYMKGKSPFKLKWLMRLYNIVQIVYNSVVILQLIFPHTQKKVYPIPFLIEVSCSIPSNFEGLDELKYLFLRGSWHFTMLKLLDLLDTIFMILRHKESHVTFLHVYHHVVMVFFSFVTAKYIKAVQGGIPVVINVFVHAVMYSYYFLATFKSLKKYLWWKRHLTKLQLAQFVVILGYIISLYYYKCPMPKLFTIIWTFNVFVIMCLFFNFYIKAYLTKSISHESDEINSKDN